MEKRDRHLDCFQPARSIYLLTFRQIPPIPLDFLTDMFHQGFADQPSRFDKTFKALDFEVPKTRQYSHTAAELLGWRSSSSFLWQEETKNAGWTISGVRHLNIGIWGVAEGIPG
jgi:hypothetical protein